ncbi:MAG: hypothetical protein AAFQ53_11005, partial [Bacteroidota bacterium]
GAIVGLTLAATAAVAATQDALWQSLWPDIGTAVQTSVPIGDHDEDGIEDIFLASGGILGNQIRFVSGATGELIEIREHPTATTTASFQFLGAARCADMDGDGLPDLLLHYSVILVDFSRYKRVIAYSSDTGSVIASTDLPDDWGTGEPPSVFAARDFDGDGMNEFAYAVNNSNVAICSFAGTGIPLRTVTQVNTFGGPTFIGVDDVNHDGVDEYAIAWPSASRVAMYSGADGNILATRQGLPHSSGVGLGREFAQVSDINSDGRRDFVVQHTGRDEFVALDGTTLEPLWRRSWAPASTAATSPVVAEWMFSSGTGYDVNADGIDDVVGFSAFRVDGIPRNARFVEVLSGRDGSSIFRMDRNGETFGTCGGISIDSIQPWVDVNGDGFGDLLWRSNNHDDCGQVEFLYMGAMGVLSGMPGGFGESFCEPLPNSTGQPSTLYPYGPPTYAVSALSFEVRNAPPGQFCQLVWGPRLGPGETGILGPWGELCFGTTGAQRVGSPSVIDGMGTDVIEIDWASDPIATQWLPGTTWVAQAVFRDDASFGGASTTNALVFEVNQ